MDNTQKLINENFKSVPKEVQRLIISSQLGDSITDIARSNVLTNDQRNYLEDEIVFVLLGLEMLSDFVKNVETEVGVSRETAEKIAIEVHKNIFSQVIGSLRQIESELKTLDAKQIQALQQKSFTPQNTNILERQGATALRPDHMLPDHEGLEAIDGPHLHSQTIMPQGETSNPAQTGGTIIDNKLSRMFRMPKEEKTVRESYKGSDPYREPAN